MSDDVGRPREAPHPERGGNQVPDLRRLDLGRLDWNILDSPRPYAQAQHVGGDRLASPEESVERLKGLATKSVDLARQVNRQIKTTLGVTQRLGEVYLGDALAAKLDRLTGSAGGQLKEYFQLICTNNRGVSYSLSSMGEQIKRVDTLNGPDPDRVARHARGANITIAQFSDWVNAINSSYKMLGYQKHFSIMPEVVSLNALTTELKSRGEIIIQCADALVAAIHARDRS